MIKLKKYILPIAIILFFVGAITVYACAPKECYGDQCEVNVTPSISPEPSVTESPISVTPTETPEVTVEPTKEPEATPTAEPTGIPNVGTPNVGLSDGKSDGKSSCPECTAPPANNASPYDGQPVGWK